MMASRKICAYKDCKSDSSDPNCTETFFAFPRDEERYQLWVELSRCDDVQGQSPKPIKYLCSKHFDHNKYLSSNPRRKLLLSTAIPFAYESESEEENERNPIASEQSLNFDVDDDNDDCTLAVVKIESTAIEEDGEIEFLEDWPELSSNCSDTEKLVKVQQENSSYSYTIFDMKNDHIVSNEQNANQRCRGKKRKLKDSVELGMEVERISKESINLREHENDNECNFDDNNISDEDLITHPDITTYFFKNEEYVRMTKSLYCSEKRQLLNEITYYKNVILDLKRKLLNVEL